MTSKLHLSALVLGMIAASAHAGTLAENGSIHWEGSFTAADEAQLLNETADREAETEKSKNPLTRLAPILVSEPKKVLGRGLYDNETQNSLALACIGDRIDSGSSERNCNVLRFLLRTAGGNEYLIGPSFSLHDQAPMKYQMEEYFAAYQIKKDLSRQKKFIVSRIVYGDLLGMKRRDEPIRSHETAKALQMGLVVAQGASVKALLPLATSTAGALGLFLGGSMLAPVVFDVATLPITALIDGKNASSIWGFGSKDLRELQDRSVPAWSLSPKRVKKSQRFQTLLVSLLQSSISYKAGESYSTLYHFEKASHGSNPLHFRIHFRIDPAFAAAVAENPGLALENPLEEQEI